MIYKQLKPLLEWRAGKPIWRATPLAPSWWTPVLLSEALSVEGIFGVVPKKLESALVGFRRRRQPERVKLCKRFLDERAVGLHMKPRDTLRQQIEDFLPPDCAACGWSQPGPHAKGCKLEPILEQISKHERIVAKLVQEVSRL